MRLDATSTSQQHVKTTNHRAKQICTCMQPTTMMSTFEHSPLDDSKDEIRLLELQPGQRGELLNIHLRQTRLSDLPTYEALSYMWGTESASHQVYINGCNFAVRSNLFDCLSELRDETEVRTLWADAICIDQTNIKERNHQVGEMRKIYAQAAQVRIWLGNPTGMTRDLFGYLNSSATERASFTWSSFIMEDQARRNGITPLRVALFDVCRRKYWERAWILQEVMVSKSKAVHCGPYSTTLEQLQASLESAGLHWWLVRSPIGIDTAHQTLQELLERRRGAACGDVKDRVYALLGVASDCTPDHPFHIDYAEDKRILLCRTVTFCRPKDRFGNAYLLLKILEIDDFVPQQTQLNCCFEAGQKHFQMQLEAFYSGAVSDISFSEYEREEHYLWQNLQDEEQAGGLKARKVYRIENSAIGFLSTSIADKEQLTFIPVFIEQVEGTYNKKLAQSKPPVVLHNVSIKAPFPMLYVSLSITPEAFLWLISESEYSRLSYQPRIRRRERKSVYYGTEQYSSTSLSDL